MRVVVWKSYGDIEVYAAETPTQLIGITKTVISCLDCFGIDECISLVELNIEKYPEDETQLCRGLNMLFRTIHNSGKHELFEDIFMTEVLEECS